jgi:hypothetical protein
VKVETINDEEKEKDSIFLFLFLSLAGSGGFIRCAGRQKKTIPTLANRARIG